MKRFSPSKKIKKILIETQVCPTCGKEIPKEIEECPFCKNRLVLRNKLKLD